MFVTFVIALALSIAMPSLLPAMLSSQLEGSARHLANYGRSVVAYSALNHEPVTVRIDLANGEYYCLNWSEEDLAIRSGMESAGLSGIEGKNSMGLTRDPNKQANGLSTGKTGQMTVQELLSQGTPEDLEFERDAVQYELDMVFHRSLIAQARNVPTQSLLDVNPLLEQDFSLTLEGKQEQREEVQDALIGHSRVPDDVVIESILLGGEEIAEGVVDIEVTPIGLSQTVSFFLKSARGEYYTVQWDPITGGSHLIRGKEAGYAGPPL